LETAEAVEWQCRSTRLVDSGIIVAPLLGYVVAMHFALQGSGFRERVGSVV
jgi:hypothetical protein